MSHLSIPDASGTGRKHIFEALHECFRGRLLKESDDSSDEDDNNEYEGEIEIGLVTIGLHDVSDDAEDGADPQ